LKVWIQRRRARGTGRVQGNEGVRGRGRHRQLLWLPLLLLLLLLMMMMMMPGELMMSMEV
jgi:hypothetical protein